MPKHILAIVSSPRKNGNSELLVDQFIAGADAAWILEKMLKADGLLFSSPTYKSCMCAQMKTLADRMYAINHILRGKDVYFIVTGAEPHREGLAAYMQSMRGIVGFYKEMHIRAELYGTGVMQKGAVAATPAMAEAYAAGLHCERPAPLSAFRSLPPLGPGAFLSVCFPRADLDKLFSRRPHFSCVCL